MNLQCMRVADLKESTGKCWSPRNRRGGGGLFRGYRRCPSGCNADIVQRAQP